MSLPLAILLLAAGGSTRLGAPKQLLDVDGEPLVRRIARRLLALGLGPVGVVIGGAGESVRAALRDLSVELVTNADWPRGIGTSIRAGVAWATARDVEAAMICLCDQPAIDPAHLRSLAATYEAADEAGGDADIVATAYAGTLGVPATFRRSTFARLLALPDDRGAKELFVDPSLRVRAVACEAATIDLDTPDDVQRWRRARGR